MDEMTGRIRLRDPEKIRERAVRMLERRIDGLTAEEVGALFSLTARHVNRSLAALPDDLKRRIRATVGRNATR
jgi:hypothetical protein